MKPDDKPQYINTCSEKKQQHTEPMEETKDEVTPKLAGGLPS